MWLISARAATTTLAVAASVAAIVVAAPFFPRLHLPSLPEDRVAKFGAATPALDAWDKVRAQRMAPGAGVADGARWNGSAGVGPAVDPGPEAVRRLLALMRDARTVADPRAKSAVPTLVVRLLKGDKRVDVMLDPVHNDLVVALDGTPVGTYDVSALHREFATLAKGLFP